MLKSIIDEEFIQLNVSASDWKEAIKKAAEPLVIKEKITKEYVNKIIEIAKETGPYIVIAKNIALPHAPTEYGGNQTAMGISVLTNPVEFGNKENDPVKYLFTFVASDNESHLEALSELVMLLEDETFFELLNKTTNKKEILSYINDIKI
ncbi:PTS sugar transporter subunit IIA [Tetragenococcus halophilus]|uniref:PTS sugar transporter subunit IIA n=1 Tax=Tetragenococcus halophilus TaxID=51669 RepID=UPI0021BB198C|nr:PTS sugar transporter subunit IIA [Tetragenococcus halophilus]MCT8311202.1 PTS sugar transporter subunit IIA [Tetragenococcus halophilus]